MDIRLIQVPYHAGDDRHPSGAGPARLVQGGGVSVLTAQGHRVTTEVIARGTLFRDTASSSAAVNKRVAAEVHAALESEQFPLVLAGSCVTSHGVLAGFDHSECGAVWLDAHADFNTPETSASGFFPGMSLAIVTGHCYPNYWDQIGNSEPIPEDAVVLFGVRDLRPEAERERLERSGIQVVQWRDGKPQGDVLAPLDELATRVRDVYLHVDFDGFDPEVAPGVVDEPVPGGMSREDAEMIVRAITERFRVKAATLATYTPPLDRDDRTLRLGVRLIETLGEGLN
jgi:arginase